MVKAILREPFFHFVALGAVIFTVYGFLHRGSGTGEAGRIVVSSGQIKSLMTTFERTWQRPPSKEETKALIDQYVREEVLSREAIKLGLEKNDSVIRRRLEQKMEFVTDDMAAGLTPDESDLRKYLAAHPEQFRREPRFNLQQVYLNPSKHGERLQADAMKILGKLLEGKDPLDSSKLGDPSLLPSALADAEMSKVQDIFGKKFAEVLSRSPEGRWVGPISSDFGLHLVRFEGSAGAAAPRFDEVKDAVRREWENSRREELRQVYFEKLKAPYEITIEWPADSPGQTTANP